MEEGGGQRMEVEGGSGVGSVELGGILVGGGGDSAPTMRCGEAGGVVGLSEGVGCGDAREEREGGGEG